MASMLKILVLADDLTGSAELGGIAYSLGLSVRIALHWKEVDKVKEDVIIVDTNSRELSPLCAYNKIKETIKECNPSKYNLIYKKVDSVLRGAITSEINAIMDSQKISGCLLIPANPSKNRNILHGEYFIDGIPIDKTDFKNDPLFPRQNANVRDLIIDATHQIVVADSCKGVSGNKICIPDVSSEAQIRSIINSNKYQNMLFAGGADFFRQLLLTRCRISTARPSGKRIPFQKKHFIIGSNTLNSESAIKNLKQQGFLVFSLPDSIILNQAHPKVKNRWVNKIISSFRSGDNIVLARPKKQFSNLKYIKKIISELTDMGIIIFKNTNNASNHFFIEGGETASLFIRKMKWQSLVIEQTDGEGIVTLREPINKHLITVKPGSYEWPTHLMKK